ncbi:MAG: hypothetical protein EOP04_02310 [Proteobacteria bacterium]|nr:MAG: hypothetical protein EOP04_02310 [Pseudomonadota bacterium]
MLEPFLKPIDSVDDTVDVLTGLPVIMDVVLLLSTHRIITMMWQITCLWSWHCFDSMLPSCGGV